MQSLNHKILTVLIPLTILITLFCTSKPDFDDSQKVEIISFIQNAEDNNLQSYSDTSSIQNETEIIQAGIADSAKARFFIYYGDTALYNPVIIFREATCVGTRVPVQIRASTNGLDTLREFNNEFAIEMNPMNLQAFKSDSVTDTIPITTARLNNGITKIYIQAKTAGSIRDGMITVSNLNSSNPILVQTRSGINFSSCITGIVGK